MTPASSARYQSRLFRFVHKQSRRFTQQCDRAWRNLQSTASWVAAVGMYPIFLLLQSRRSTANQVHQAVEATLRQLPSDDAIVQKESPTVDTPIRQVLLYVKGAGSASVQGAGERRELGEQLPTTNYQLPITNYPIQGIASQLASRNLVLVTAQNQTLDVIDPQQQATLQEQIVTAIAQYWQYRQKIGHQSQLHSTGGFRNPPVPTPPWLTSLDHTVAEVESHHLVRVKSAAIAFYQGIFSQSTDIAGSERPTADVQTEASSKTHATRILSLIWAAIDYFFGTDDRATTPSITTSTTHKRVSPLTGRSIPVNPKFPARRPTAKLPASNDSADRDLEDPWLTASDLFGSVTPETTGDRAVPTFALPTNPIVDYTFPQERGRLRQFLSKIRAPKGIAKQQTTANDSPNPPYKGGQQSTPEISRLQNRASKKISPLLRRGVGEIEPRAKSAEIRRTSKVKQSLHKAEPSNISTPETRNSSMQSTPDWIETPATLMGYVKHPLEQILAWLDRAMLWFEEVFLKFWQWIHKLWRKF
ncbi:MAG: hypothetical protein N4J56_005744 [Chroococcidiopsis sp. SAG 2025]|uniref:hypothetical protein n=2 Tax=Chroococcidiopsidaceae TaxID=1890528 RepID=UPI0029371C29|nr:hypothetical protein [Chroococcidiopsis sp. SAG 2025]MDV2996090.1 hypothetical protein [Chroococcidiopsis sp. SAG 2025]